MLRLKKISVQLLMALCLVFVSNTPAYSQGCGNADDCNNGCGNDCAPPTYGSGACDIGVLCCYNPNQPQQGSYWSTSASCSTLLNPNAYQSGDCAGCTCCYNPDDNQDKCVTWD